MHKTYYAIKIITMIILPFYLGNENRRPIRKKNRKKFNIKRFCNIPTCLTMINIFDLKKHRQVKKQHAIYIKKYLYILSYHCHDHVRKKHTAYIPDDIAKLYNKQII